MSNAMDNVALHQTKLFTYTKTLLSHFVYYFTLLVIICTAEFYKTNMLITI